LGAAARDLGTEPAAAAAAATAQQAAAVLDAAAEVAALLLLLLWLHMLLLGRRCCGGSSRTRRRQRCHRLQPLLRQGNRRISTEGWSTGTQGQRGALDRAASLTAAKGRQDRAVLPDDWRQHQWRHHFLMLLLLLLLLLLGQCGVPLLLP
jgi:hypothetical protein